jgi:hypothetical protein
VEIVALGELVDGRLNWVQTPKSSIALSSPLVSRTP